LTCSLFLFRLLLLVTRLVTRVDFCPPFLPYAWFRCEEDFAVVVDVVARVSIFARQCRAAADAAAQLAERSLWRQCGWWQIGRRSTCKAWFDGCGLTIGKLSGVQISVKFVDIPFHFFVFRQMLVLQRFTEIITTFGLGYCLYRSL